MLMACLGFGHGPSAPARSVARSWLRKAKNNQKSLTTGLTGLLSKQAPCWQRIRELHAQRFGSKANGRSV